MLAQALFGISIAFSFIAWGIVAARYIWPILRKQSLVDALRPLLILHSFRFLGLAFLMPGVVAAELPSAFASPAAYGDLIAAVWALFALAGLQSGWVIPLVWVFNLWGTADLLYAFYHGNAVGLVPGQLGAAYFIPTFVVPLLFITHGFVFWLLLIDATGRSPKIYAVTSQAAENSERPTRARGSSASRSPLPYAGPGARGRAARSTGGKIWMARHAAAVAIGARWHSNGS